MTIKLNVVRAYWLQKCTTEWVIVRNTAYFPCGISPINYRKKVKGIRDQETLQKPPSKYCSFCLQSILVYPYHMAVFMKVHTFYLQNRNFHNLNNQKESEHRFYLSLLDVCEVFSMGRRLTSWNTIFWKAKYVW